jgi:DNA-binding FadR family transcriptional regulator
MPSGFQPVARGNTSYRSNHHMVQTGSPTMPAKLPHQPGVSLYASLLQQLGGRILRGDLPPGTQLDNVEELSAAHGVSRTVMREVIRVLTDKGMLQSRPRTGTRVRPRDAWNFLDPDLLAWRYGSTSQPADTQALFELRRAIEPAAGALAAQRATPEQIAELEGYFALMEQYADDGPRFAEPDLAFHQLILRMTGNELIGSPRRLDGGGAGNELPPVRCQSAGPAAIAAAASPGDRLHQEPRCQRRTRCPAQAAGRRRTRCSARH